MCVAGSSHRPMHTALTVAYLKMETKYVSCKVRNKSLGRIQVNSSLQKVNTCVLRSLILLWRHLNGSLHLDKQRALRKYLPWLKIESTSMCSHGPHKAELYLLECSISTHARTNACTSHVFISCSITLCPTHDLISAFCRKILSCCDFVDALSLTTSSFMPCISHQI